MTTIDLSKNQPPSVDGHFWVVRDNKIIDPHFSSYNMISKIRKVNVKKQVHIQADPIVQKVIIKLWSNFLDTIPSIVLDSWTNQPDMCVFNAFAEQKKNGGEIVFGSMGWGDWIEYGGIDWKLHQFLKK
jgi:hypothetical protein